MGDRTNLIASFEVDSLFPTDITFTLSLKAVRLILFHICGIFSHGVPLGIRMVIVSYLYIRIVYYEDRKK